MINLKDKKTKIILVASLFVLVAVVLVLILKFSIHLNDPGKTLPSPGIEGPTQKEKDLPTKPSGEINSFEECAKAGYPVTLSYPQRCRVPGGRIFTED